jgi:hypothetical protein
VETAANAKEHNIIAHKRTSMFVIFVEIHHAADGLCCALLARHIF